MSSIHVPGFVLDEDAPQPIMTRIVTIIEGLDPDGGHWINVVRRGVPDDDMRGILRMAANTFPAQQTAGYDSGMDGV